MSYEAVVAGLKERFTTVAGIKTVLDYEPTAAQHGPLLYILFDRAERSQPGQVTVMTYTVLCRLIIQWQDSKYAERELIPFVNSIPAVIDQQPTLPTTTEPTTRITSGMARVTTVTGGFVTIANTLYRSLDVSVEVVDKGAYKGGL